MGVWFFRVVIILVIKEMGWILVWFFLVLVGKMRIWIRSDGEIRRGGFFLKWLLILCEFGCFSIFCICIFWKSRRSSWCRIWGLLFCKLIIGLLMFGDVLCN